jgi:hypothetical protein
MSIFPCKVRVSCRTQPQRLVKGFCVKTGSRVVAVVGAVVVLASSGGAISSAAVTESHSVTSGNVAITVTAATAKAVHGAGLHFTMVSPATRKNSDLRLPVSSGKVNAPNYVVRLAGGLQIASGSKVVTIKHIIVNSKTSRATANVTGRGNIVTFVLGDPQSGSGGPHMFQIGGYPVRFSSAAIKALDKAFTTSVFANHPMLGRGTTTVRWTK